MIIYYEKQKTFLRLSPSVNAYIFVRPKKYTNDQWQIVLDNGNSSIDFRCEADANLILTSIYKAVFKYGFENVSVYVAKDEVQVEGTKDRLV